MSSYEIVHISPTKAELLFHQLPNSCFDRANKPSLRCIVHHFLKGCLSAQNEGFTDKIHLCKDTNNFFIGIRMVCSLTSKMRKVSKYQYNSCIATSTMSDIGKSSLTLKVTLTNYFKYELWGKFLVKLVHVNRDTGKTIPLPNWYIRRFQEVIDRRETLPEMSCISDVPTNAFRTHVDTALSDLEPHHHVVTSGYFQFFTDCATKASAAKYYKHFVNDICWYPVKSFDALILRESWVGEILTICTWQGKEDISAIYFACLKEDTYVMKAVIVYGLEMIEPKLPPHHF